MRTKYITHIVILRALTLLFFVCALLAAYYVYHLSYDVADTIVVFIIVNLFTIFAQAEVMQAKLRKKEDDWYEQWLSEQFGPKVRMSKERYDAIMMGREQLTQLDIDNGYHFCPDWDGLLIHRSDEEYKHCHCDL